MLFVVVFADLLCAGPGGVKQSILVLGLGSGPSSRAPSQGLPWGFTYAGYSWAIGGSGHVCVPEELVPGWEVSPARLLLGASTARQSPGPCRGWWETQSGLSRSHTPAQLTARPGLPLSLLFLSISNLLTGEHLENPQKKTKPLMTLPLPPNTHRDIF